MVKTQRFVAILNATTLFLIMTCIAGCSDPAIKKVKDAHFPGDELLSWNDFFNAITIDPSWSTSSHPRGGTKVVVSGKIPPDISSRIAKECLIMAAYMDDVSTTYTIGGRLLGNVFNLDSVKTCHDDYIASIRTGLRTGPRYFLLKVLGESPPRGDQLMNTIGKINTEYLLAAEKEVASYIRAIHDPLALSLEAEFQVASLGLRFEKGMIVIPAGPYAGEYTFNNSRFYRLLQLK